MIIKKVESVPKEPVDDAGVQGVKKQVLLGPADGAPNFTLRQFTVEPGGYTFYHKHDYEHEIYVIAGSGIARSAHGETPISPQTIILINAGEVHQIVNHGTEELVFLCLIPNV